MSEQDVQTPAQPEEQDNDGLTAFVTGGVEESEKATTALRAAGYRPVNPVELDEIAGMPRILDDEATRSVTAARDRMAASDCDIVVIVPGEPASPAHADIVSDAIKRGATVDRIDYLVPAWDAEVS